MKKININDIEIKDYIHSGSYGIVSSCIYNNNNFVYKRIKNINYLNGKKRKINNISKNINHDNLVLPKVWITDNNNNINGYLTNYFNSCDLADLMKNYSLNDKIKTLKNLKQTIIFMHKNNLIHADLIPGNILQCNNTCKIIDFDNSSYNNSEINITEVNDYSYDFIKNYGLIKEVDIFLFNIITYSIINDIDFYLVRESIYKKDFKYFDNEDAIKLCKTFFLQDKCPNKDFLIDMIDDSITK